MTTDQSWRIGTRGSDLAMWQARHVAGLIEEHLNRPTRTEIITTDGDRRQDLALHQMPGTGFFTKALQQALMNHEVDLVVHSLKDLPTEEPHGLTIAAVCSRGKPWDLLAAKAPINPTPNDPLGVPPRARIGTSSLRRASQLLALRPDVRIEPIRGNVPTRLDKLRHGPLDAIMIAAAGVRRLELEPNDLHTLELPPEVVLPAPGQGALAVEARSGDPIGEALEALHDSTVARCVAAERTLLKLLGGGCHLPLGAHATLESGGAVRLEAVLGKLDDAVQRAEVSRVGAVAREPRTAAGICNEALRETMPEAIGP